MSGVLGVIDPQRRVDAGRLANQMIADMTHHEWIVSDLFVDQQENLALGRLGIGIFNQAQQPVWNCRHDVALVMAGEYYNAGDLGKRDARQSLECFTLEKYEQLGECFFITRSSTSPSSNKASHSVIMSM